MNDDDTMELVRPHLDPFLRATEQHAAGNNSAAIDVIKQRVLYAEPTGSDDEDELARAWGMISVGALVAGAALRKCAGAPTSPDDTFCFVQLMNGDGQWLSLDEELGDECATAIRLIIAGANDDLDTGIALVSATWEQAGADGIMSVLGSLVWLYADLETGQ